MILRLASTAYTWSEGDGVVTVVIEKIGTNERNISACLQADPQTARGQSSMSYQEHSDISIVCCL